jgi:hypothetical protein
MCHVRIHAAFGALVSVPTVTLSAHKGGGGEREFIRPLLSADGCA